MVDTRLRLVLILLTVILAIALTFATVEIRRLINEVLYDEYGEALFPSADSGRDLDLTEPSCNTTAFARSVTLPASSSSC